MSTNRPDPSQRDTPRRRIRLALSILEHRHFCPVCERHAEAAELALLGATIDELRQIDSP